MMIITVDCNSDIVTIGSKSFPCKHPNSVIDLLIHIFDNLSKDGYLNEASYVTLEKIDEDKRMIVEEW